MSIIEESVWKRSYVDADFRMKIEFIDMRANKNENDGDEFLVKIL